MNWALITNTINPGDIWACLGVELIIRFLDATPIIIRIRREGKHGIGPQAFPNHFEPDLIVVCSMPFVWSHFDQDGTENNTITHHSWREYTTWMAEKLIFAGFGTYLIYQDFPRTYQFPGQEKIINAIKNLFDKCRLVYSRSRIAKNLFGPDMMCLPCPSIFAGMDLPATAELKLCNLMPGGAHYPWLQSQEEEIWSKKLPEIAATLVKAGFCAIAHNKVEADLAKGLGFEKIFKYSDDPLDFLQVYSKCRRYFGNRIHGGIVARSFGADVLCCGYDTRLTAIESVGGSSCTPKTLGIDDLKLWIDQDTSGKIFPKLFYFNETCRLFQETIENCKKPDHHNAHSVTLV